MEISVQMAGRCDPVREREREQLHQRGGPRFLNILPVPAEMPPGPISAPPRFPWGRSGHLPKRLQLFSSFLQLGLLWSFLEDSS